MPSRFINKVTANQPASVGLVKTNIEKLYKEELDNPNRPASKLKTDALAMYEKVQRARELTVKTVPTEEVSKAPAVTSLPATEIPLDDVVRRASYVLVNFFYNLIRPVAKLFCH